jgi:hypothetical protein
MKEKFKGFVMGVAACISLTGTAVYAAEATQVNVYFQNLTYMFDGEEKKSGSEQGFIYNGTTYVPLRFVSESIGKKVEWDEGNNTIWVGKREKSSDYLTNIPAAKENEGAIDGAFYDNVLHIAGTAYMQYGIKVVLPLVDTEQRSASKSGSIEYNLNGKYMKLTGNVGIDDRSKNSTALGSFKILGDGKELSVIENLRGGDLPKSVDVDVKGVSKLEIIFTRDDKDALTIDFVDAKLD